MSEKVCPREPTEAMVAVVEKMRPPVGSPEQLASDGYCQRWRERHRHNAIEIWAAMFDAAPAPMTERVDRLQAALRAIKRDPYGCPFCDSGKLRKPNDPLKGHNVDCGYLLLDAALGEE